MERRRWGVVTVCHSAFTSSHLHLYNNLIQFSTSLFGIKMHLAISPVAHLSPYKLKQSCLVEFWRCSPTGRSAASATWVCPPPEVTSRVRPEKSQIIENWRDITRSRKKATSNTDDYKHICCVLHLNDVTMKCIRRWQCSCAQSTVVQLHRN